MVVGDDPRYFGMRLENGRISDLIYCKKLRSKFACLGRTSESRNRDKRATPIVGGENYALKLEILFTSKCHLREVCVISRFEASSHQDSLDQLELPPQLLDVHDVFHVSQLKKYLRAPEELKYPWKIWMARKIFHTKSTLSRL
jgi:hypothetical protein